MVEVCAGDEYPVLVLCFGVLLIFLCFSVLEISEGNCVVCLA